jgi:hypothetical protein
VQHAIFTRSTSEGMTGPKPAITSPAQLLTAMPERFWIPTQTYAADGGTRPKLRGRSVSSALPCISPRQLWIERRRRYVSARKFPDARRIPKTHFSTASLRLQDTLAKTRSVQQAWMNSRNLLNIASAGKHRQPMFLHPTVSERERRFGSRLGTRKGTSVYKSASA